MVQVYRDFRKAAKNLASILDKNGDIVPIKRENLDTETKELKNVAYTIEKPLEREIGIENLELSKLWCYGEVLTHFLNLNPMVQSKYVSSSKIDLDEMRWADGMQTHLYGERWHDKKQFKSLVEKLDEQKNTRQAVMVIYDPSMDLHPKEWHGPCTVLHQFLVRDDTLYTSVYLRSNDFFVGWKNDMFFNSFVHDAVAGFAGVEPGPLTFHTGSFHAYKKDYGKLSAVKNAKVNNSVKEYEPFGMGPDEFWDELWAAKDAEELSRAKRFGEAHRVVDQEISHELLEDMAKVFIEKNQEEDDIVCLP